MKKKGEELEVELAVEWKELDIFMASGLRSLRSRRRFVGVARLP